MSRSQEASVVLLTSKTKLFVFLKNIFVFRQNSAECTHKLLNPEAQNLKTRPRFLNYTTITQAADIKDLYINFRPATYIFPGIGESFINLKELEIQYQYIKFVERSDFADLTQLEELYLDHNQIEFLPEDVFWDLPNLEELWISDNKITKLPENIFKNLKKIKRITFHQNKIEHLPKDLFVNNLEIEEIYAQDNPLKIIDVDFTALKNLRKLILRNANCINFRANNTIEVPEAQSLINQNCRKTTQK